MRIKLFEDYTDGIERLNPREYYELFSTGEVFDRVNVDGNYEVRFREDYSKNWEDFTNDEINELGKYATIEIFDKANNSKYSASFKGKEAKSAIISKLKDEWYIISITEFPSNGKNVYLSHFSTLNKFYKCDQLDSLIKLIKSIK